MANIVTTTQWGTTIISNAEASANITSIFNNTFSTTPNVSPASPTGAFIQELTDMEVNVSSTVAYVTSNVYSLKNTQGVFLDGLGNLFGFQRSLATYSTVNIVVTGVTNTVIPAGSIVSDGVNNYIITSAYTINNGVNTISVSSSTIGAVVIPANTITTIITPVSGWASVNNPTAGTTGSNIQSDTAYRYTFAYSQAINGRGLEDSLYAIFLNFMNQQGATTYTDTAGYTYPYVWGFYTYVNRTDSPVKLIDTEAATIPVGGVYITLYAPNFLNSSLPNYNANLQYIAGLILNQIGANQTVNIATISGSQQFNVQYNNAKYPQIQPVTIYFDSPAPTAILFAFTIKVYNTTQSIDTITRNVVSAIMSQFYLGYENYLPATMGVDINTADYILTIINAIDGPASIIDQTVQLATGGTANTILTLKLNQVATLDATGITITIE